ncbi:sulfite exporter TauE/SafE family protein [Nocardioides sp. SR21]|uniref:sulfite exporter TauE/SafE family protein n=1 Tax=Nocardioides sp. SR21 TaxID=2919501 RepID=UPI00242C89B1|nr:sulfite exporter TauE/SafE family protein [Nocardioides sp. SR21]
MWILAVFALAGGLAQLVDGTLGMGFGVTSATVLLFMGVAPVTASAATHAAKLPTTLVSGLSHWREGNVDPAVLLRVALPGMAGGFLGAVVLTNISLTSAKAWMSGLLIFFGLVIFARFGLGVRLIPTPERGHTARWLSPIGLLGGFVDATGGGGWGPVVTPSLMTVTRHEPRKVIGTVNAAEFLVAVSVSFGFLTGAAQHGIPWLPVAGLALGGVIMAPIAARLAGRLPHAAMGTMVGGLVILVNAITIVAALGGLPGWVDAVLILFTVAVVGTVARRAWRRERDERAVAAPVTPGQPQPCPEAVLQERATREPI